MKRIDQAEINYIFREANPYWNGQLIIPITAHEKVVKVLAKNPVAALAATWHMGMGHSGLSPFTMHYLLRSNLPVADWTEKYIKKSRSVKYTYCHATQLPVINNLFRRDWNHAGSILPPGPSYPISHWDRPYYDKLEKRRDERFDELLANLTAAKAAGVADDEYMRKFGGHPIRKDYWLRLKGVAGIYL